MSKILIHGFPHCGTSILKSIIGHCESVDEIYNETITIRDTQHKFVLGKYPFTLDCFYDDPLYKSYIKIFIIRNPLFVFSSLNKRFKNEIDHQHSIDEYISTLRLFIKLRNMKNNTNTFFIRYEDLFENNHNNLKIILDTIGISYSNDIFDNTRYTNVHIQDVPLLPTAPLNEDHSKYRTWQINQSFVSYNDVSKIQLTKAQLEKITENEDILCIYPEVKSLARVLIHENNFMCHPLI
jgi:hypothetical protein